MSTSTILVVAGAFLASAVEMVEALTIVLGVGVVRGWRSTLIGAGAACLVLAVLVAALGPALGSIPIDALRLVVGALLLAFGLQWLRKAILRSSGYKALHDEDEAFREERAQAAAAGDEQRGGLDWYSFTVAFKGVLLEGLEVVFIVIAFGSAARSPRPRGRRRRRCTRRRRSSPESSRKGPLSRVPENTIKFAVGLLLTSFGCFWGAEGAGVALAGRRGLAARRDRLLRRRVVRARARAAPPARRSGHRRSGSMKYLRALRPLLVELHRRRRLARRRRRGGRARAHRAARACRRQRVVAAARGGRVAARGFAAACNRAELAVLPGAVEAAALG